MTWYTWVFDGVGAAAATSAVGWLLSRLKRKPTGTSQQGSHAAYEPPRPQIAAQAAGQDPVAVAPASPVPGPISGGLIDSLLAIPGMSDPTFRGTVYERIPAAIVQQLQIDKRARIELINLIDTFAQYPHLHPWRALLDRLGELLPAHPAVDHLAANLAKLGLIENAE